MHDIIIRGGTVVDGTGQQRFAADLGVTADRITAIGDLSEADCGRSIDARNLIVAPGFVDVHNHSDGWMLKCPSQPSKTLQGFTTEVLMLDGIGYAPVNEDTWREWLYYLRPLDGLRVDEYEGWQSIEDFMTRLDRRTAQNAMTHVPYANVRSLICGFGPGAVSEYQMRQIQEEIRKGMDAGAVGLSSGLDYIVQCWSTTEELIDACRPVAEYGGLYATHIRYKMGMIPALNEALHIARESGAGLHVSHLKAITGETADGILNWVEKARKEVPLSFDVYPYMPGSTMLNYLLPYEVWEDGPLAALSRLNDRTIRHEFRSRLKAYKLDLDSIRIAWLPGKENSQHQGTLLSDYVASVGLPAEEALLNLLIEERMGVLCVYLEGDDRLIDPFLQHDLYMMGSDGILTDGGMTHPRQFGSASRVIGSCVRDHGLFSLEEAVTKLTSGPANRFGMTDRGTLREGSFADIAVFDPQTVADTATYEAPQQTATGMQHVLVNGQVIVCDGTVAGADLSDSLPGRYVRFRQ